MNIATVLTVLLDYYCSNIKSVCHCVS